jgi:hypothetical protein
MALTVIFGALTACRAADDAKSQASVIAEVGELGENVYDLAKDKDWAKIDGKLADLKRKAPELHSKQLSESLAALQTAVAAKERTATMQQANQITLIAAELSEPFHPQIPTDITRLDFYGREVEIWSAEKNAEKLKKSIDALGKTWRKVRGAVVDHGGMAEAKKFEDLVNVLRKARTQEQYTAAIGPILDEVDNLEKVFTK